MQLLIQKQLKKAVAHTGWVPANKKHFKIQEEKSEFLLFAAQCRKAAS